MEDLDVDVMIILKIIFRGVGYVVVDICNNLRNLSAGSFFCEQDSEPIGF